jgi:hypothetical protein
MKSVMSSLSEVLNHLSQIIVIPAQAEIHRPVDKTFYVPGSARSTHAISVLWIPACAGMTGECLRKSISTTRMRKQGTATLRIGPQVFILQLIPIPDRRHPRQSVVMKMRMLRQVVGLAPVFTMNPPRVLLHFKASAQQQWQQSGNAQTDARHVGKSLGLFWVSCRR